MKVMISLPMNGKKDSDVRKRIKELTKEFEQLHIEVVDSFLTDEVKNSYHPGVYYLGRTLMKFMHNVDAVYFDKGWKDARGCRIERKICEEYGIKILDTDFLSKDDITILSIPDTTLHITPCGNDVYKYCSNDISNTRRYANKHISYGEGSNG